MTLFFIDMFLYHLFTGVVLSFTLLALYINISYIALFVRIFFMITLLKFLVGKWGRYNYL